MVGRWAGHGQLYVSLLLLIFGTALVDSDCWEGCFSTAERGLQHPEYEQIIGLLQSFKKAMITDANSGTGTSNGTAILLDTSLPSGTDREAHENVQNIQKRLGQILALSLPMLSNFNPGFLVKYDENSAWTCDDWHCLGRCDMFELLENEGFNFTSGSDVNSGSIDMLDESCEMASTAATSSTCSGSTYNIFAVAIVNSDFKTAEIDFDNFDESMLSSGLDILSEMEFNHNQYNFDEVNNRDEFNFYCDKHFPKKAIIGTYSASARSLAEFPSAATSNWPGYTQVMYSPAMAKATERISQCMKSMCCSNWSRPEVFSSSSSSCSRFQNGHSHSYFK